MLRSTRLTVLAAILGAATLALIVSPALAATEPAAGTFVEAPETILEERQSGGNMFIYADGSFNAHMTIEFTGVACAQPVALTFLIVGKGDFNTNVIGGQYSGVPGVGGTYEGKVHCD